jgi:hypothetical protein
MAMSHQIHRVKRGPPAPLTLPHDHWKDTEVKETILIEADGTEMFVKYCGKMPTSLWPEGRETDKDRKPARLHLRHA